MAESEINVVINVDDSQFVNSLNNIADQSAELDTVIGDVSESIADNFDGSQLSLTR